MASTHLLVRLILDHDSQSRLEQLDGLTAASKDSMGLVLRAVACRAQQKPLTLHLYDPPPKGLLVIDSIVQQLQRLGSCRMLVFKGMHDDESCDVGRRWDLSWCRALCLLTCNGVHSLPSSYTALQRLLLDQCNNFTELPEQCGASLEYLMVQCCPLVACIPNTLHRLSHLRLSSCPSIAALPTDGLGALTCLELCDCPKISSLPSSNCTSLTHLKLVECPMLARLPEQLTALTSLYVVDCSSLTDLPDAYGPSLQRLSLLYCTRIARVPATYTNLEVLSLRCGRPLSLPETCPILSHLELISQPIINGLPRHCTSLRVLRLDLIGPTTFFLDQQGHITIHPIVPNAYAAITQMHITAYRGTSLPDTCSGLLCLQLHRCRSVSSIPSAYTRLRHLVLHECDGITQLPEACASTLEKLDLRRNKNIIALPRSYAALQLLKIEEVPGITSVPDTFTMLRGAAVDKVAVLESAVLQNLELVCLNADTVPEEYKRFADGCTYRTICQQMAVCSSCVSVSAAFCRSPITQSFDALFS